MKTNSLRTRLVIIFTLLLFFAWLISAAIGYIKVRQRLRDNYDAQQIFFAQRLERSNLDDLLKIKPQYDKTAFRADRFTKAQDALAFAIFSLEGKKLLGDRTNEPALDKVPEGIASFSEPQFIEKGPWRVLWLVSQDRRFIIAVGQQNAYRTQLAQKILLDHQVTPWAMLVPAMLLVIFLLINRELAPLKRVANALKQRQPDDETPIDVTRLPEEILPFIDALNGLFRRTGALLTRERRFISDAAHELRTPLSALKVQTEVALLTADKPTLQQRALDNLNHSIDRAARLVDQLLVLSRLDDSAAMPEWTSINGQELLREIEPTFFDTAKQNGITLRFHYKGAPIIQKGNVVLLSLLMRNLIDNALHYTQQGDIVQVTLTDTALTVEDTGPGVTDEQLARLGERFYRPAGQKKTGSGLGLSIVKQITQLHGFSVTFRRAQPSGFIAYVQFSPTQRE